MISDSLARIDVVAVRKPFDTVQERMKPIELGTRTSLCAFSKVLEFLILGLGHVGTTTDSLTANGRGGCGDGPSQDSTNAKRMRFHCCARRDCHIFYVTSSVTKPTCSRQVPNGLG